MKQLKRIGALVLSLALMAGMIPQTVISASAAAKPAISVSGTIEKGSTGKVTVKKLKKGQKVQVAVKNNKILKASKTSLTMTKAGTAKITLKALKAGSTKVTVKVSTRAKGSWNLVTKKSFTVKVRKSPSADNDVASRIEYETPWVNSSVGDVVKRGYDPDLKDDFYTAANYKKLSTLELDPTHAAEGTFYQVEYDLDKDREAVLKDISITGHDADLVRNYYDLFLDWDGRNKAGISVLQPQIEKIEAIKDIEGLSSYFLSEDGQMYGIDLSSERVTVDPSDSSKYIVYIGDTSLSLGDSAEYSNPTAYGQIMSQFYSLTTTYMLQRLGYTDEQITGILAKKYSFEKKIAASIVTNEEAVGADLSKYMNYYTFDELAKASPNYPLADIVKVKGMSGSKKFLISETKWLDKLNELYNAENFDEIKAYVLAMTAVGYISATDEEAYRYYLGIYNQISGITESKPDEYYALNAAKGSLMTSFSKMYVQKYADPKVKKDVTQMCENILDSYRTMIKNEDWMSDATKEKALEKLDAMKIKAVYPEEWEDYSGLTFKSKAQGGTYFDAIVAISEYEEKKSLALINQTVNKNKWSLEMVDLVNAMYDSQENSFYIFAGILNGDMYNSGMSEEEKLGKIGYIIGHEISHAFDVNGSQFDKDGNVADWWTAEDKAAFEKKSANLISYFDKMKMFDGSRYSGRRVQAETVADMAGMKAALTYAATKENFDYDKFFRGAADVWCEISNTQNMQINISQDVHALNYLRVNAVLQQFDEFIETYNIKPGDGMYLAPEDRVLVW